MVTPDPMPDLLQAFEQVLESNKRIAFVAAMLIEAQQHGRQLPGATLTDYGEQLKNVERDREQMTAMVAALWQTIGRGHAH
jgi:hypothetical protein